MRLKSIGILSAIAFLAMACPASQATDMSGARISSLEIESDIGGDTVFIQLNMPKTSFPTCQTNTGWHFVISLNTSAGRHMYAMLLIAQAEQLPVRVRGIGQCDIFGSVETATGVGLLVQQ